MPGKPSSSRWTRLLYALLISVVILLVIFLIVRQGRSPVEAPNQSSSARASQDESDRSSTAGSTSAIESSPTTEPVTASPDGLHLTAAIPLNINDAIKLVLPESYAQGGFKLLHILPDGRLIIQTAMRLSIVDPRDMSEIVVKTAEFGLQAIANDRFIVYGVGGDEVFQLEVYTISSGSQSIILEDVNGYFGFEIDEDNHFYTTKVEALKYGKDIGPWLDYDLVAGELKTLNDLPHSLGLNDLLAAVPDANLDWTYEIGQPWFEAWRIDAATGFALEISYLDIYQEQYEYRLYRLDNESHEALPETAEALIGSRPYLYDSDQLFVFDGHSFFDPKTDRWYALEAADGHEDFSVLGMTPARDALYLTKFDLNKQTEDLWLAPIEQLIVP